MIAIPEELLKRLIEELKLAQKDVFVKDTETLIQEAEVYLNVKGERGDFVWIDKKTYAVWKPKADGRFIMGTDPINEQ
jgi:hypothetical protein